MNWKECDEGESDRKISVREQPDEIDPSIQIVYKGAKKIKNVKYVGAPPPGYLDNSNFDTLWSVAFTLTPEPDDTVYDS